MKQAWKAVAPLLVAIAILGAQAAVPRPTTAMASGGHPEIRQGTAITEPGANAQILWIIPGQRFVYDEIFLHNESKRPLTIQSIELQGGGIPDVLDTYKRSMAPLDPDPDTAKLDGTPAGIWRSYPPTMHLYDDVPCTVQRTEPIREFVLEPGASTRVMVVMHATKVGQVKVLDDKVIYRQNGRLYRQVLPNELRVHVRTPGWVIKPTKIERECRSLGNILPFD